MRKQGAEKVGEDEDDDAVVKCVIESARSQFDRCIDGDAQSMCAVTKGGAVLRL